MHFSLEEVRNLTNMAGKPNLPFLKKLLNLRDSLKTGLRVHRNNVNLGVQQKNCGLVRLSEMAGPSPVYP